MESNEVKQIESESKSPIILLDNNNSPIDCSNSLKRKFPDSPPLVANKKEKIDESLENSIKLTAQCPACHEIPRGNIVQCFNSHSLCEKCYIQLPSPKTCPTCRTSMITVIRNRALEEIVSNLQDECIFGCSTKLKIPELKIHEEQSCPNRIMTRFCQNQFFGCTYSGGVAKNMELHEKECKYDPSTFSASDFRKLLEQKSKDLEVYKKQVGELNEKYQAERQKRKAVVNNFFSVPIPRNLTCVENASCRYYRTFKNTANSHPKTWTMSLPFTAFDMTFYAELTTVQDITSNKYVLHLKMEASNPKDIIPFASYSVMVHNYTLPFLNQHVPLVVQTPHRIRFSHIFASAAYDNLSSFNFEHDIILGIVICKN